MDGKARRNRRVVGGESDMPSCSVEATTSCKGDADDTVTFGQHTRVFPDMSRKKTLTR